MFRIARTFVSSRLPSCSHHYYTPAASSAINSGRFSSLIVGYPSTRGLATKEGQSKSSNDDSPSSERTKRPDKQANSKQSTPPTSTNSTSRRSTKDVGVGAMTWRSTLIGLSLGGVMLGIMYYVKSKKDKEIARERYRQLGKSLIGGYWELLDHEGNAKSTKDFLGQWYLIYFGFTHCPDVCPEEIEKMVEVVNLCEKRDDTPNVRGFVFSVDPERDTIGAMKKYVSEFSPKLVGFTGSKEQVDKVCRTFRVYHSKGPADDDNDYIVDHTIIHYLVDPDGQFVDYFGQNKNPQQIADGIGMALLKWEQIQ